MPCGPPCKSRRAPPTFIHRRSKKMFRGLRRAPRRSLPSRPRRTRVSAGTVRSHWRGLSLKCATGDPLTHEVALLRAAAGGGSPAPRVRGGHAFPYASPLAFLRRLACRSFALPRTCGCILRGFGPWCPRRWCSWRAAPPPMVHLSHSTRPPPTSIRRLSMRRRVRRTLRAAATGFVATVRRRLRARGPRPSPSSLRAARASMEFAATRPRRRLARLRAAVTASRSWRRHAPAVDASRARRSPAPSVVRGSSALRILVPPSCVRRRPRQTASMRVVLARSQR